jgi:hypothetical protein
VTRRPGVALGLVGYVLAIWIASGHTKLDLFSAVLVVAVATLVIMLST